ncbi:hypothetical protein EDC04DRAFT_2600946 [Pisolithus marmoratus]|nr:hypothetical protein EDC04DRAFT_2600946 [Pisolithus marmoratus]
MSVQPHVEDIGQGTSPPVVMEARWAIQDTTKGKSVRPRQVPVSLQGKDGDIAVQPHVEDFADMDMDPMEVDAHQETGAAIADYSSKPWGGRVAHLWRREGAVADLNMLAAPTHTWRYMLHYQVGSVILSTSNQRKMLVPTYYMEGEELEDQPVSPVKVVGHENFGVAMGMDYDAESNNEFDQPIYEEVQTGLKCKQSDHNDNNYVMSSKVEDSNDGYEDHDLHFHMGPAEDLSVKMTINGKKVKVNKNMDQELGQASSMTTRGKASKCHCQKDLPSVLMEDRAWAKIIMPTLLIWARGLADPWTILDDKLMQLLQTIITSTFPDFLHLDEICPGMLMHLNNYACTSPNMLNLVFEDLKRTGIKGALAPTCAALHHTLTLYNEGMLDLDATVATGKAKMPLKMNKATGKESTTALMFSEWNCGSHTRQYADAIAKHDDATPCEILFGATVLTSGSKQVISEEGTVKEKDTATLLITNLFEIAEMIQE